MVFFSAAVAPALFRIIPERSLAGEIVGTLLPMLYISGMAVAVLAAIALLISRSPGTRSQMAGATSALLMLLSLSVAHGVIGGRIADVRSRAGGALDALPPGDPLRQQFGALHGYSVVALGIAVAAALGLLWVIHRRGGASVDA